MGRSQPGGGDPFEQLNDVWHMFGLEGQPIDQRSVTELVNGIAVFDRSQLPEWSPLYSDFALMRLHERLAVLTLVFVGGVDSEPIRSPVERVLERLSRREVVPVLAEVPTWIGDPHAGFAAAQLSRLSADSTA